LTKPSACAFEPKDVNTFQKRQVKLVSDITELSVVVVACLKVVCFE